MFAKFGSKRHQVETAVSLRRTLYGQDSLGVISLPMSATFHLSIARIEREDVALGVVLARNPFAPQKSFDDVRVIDEKLARRKHHVARGRVPQDHELAFATATVARATP